MSFAFLPLYTGDYRRDTQHLSCSEHGIYLLLLMHCWDSQGPVPLDERRISGIVNARSGDEIEALRRVLFEFFVRTDDGWYNERMQDEVAKANFVSEKRSDAGKMGAAARETQRRIKAIKQKLGNSQASAKLVPDTPTPTLTPTPTTIEQQNPSSDSDPVTRNQRVRTPPCPIQQIIDGYNEICAAAGCIRLQVRNAARDSHISARWHQIFSDGAAATAPDGLQFFHGLFTAVARSKFLTGQARTEAGRKPFRADLDWLMGPQNFAKVIEGKYE